MTRSRHYTAWAGALAMAAELSRREYDAAITLGNTPTRDLLCASPSGEPFTVQVKSLAKPNWVLIGQTWLEAHPRDDLYLAVVLVPLDTEAPCLFHILTHHEAIWAYLKQPTTKKDGTPFKPGMTGLDWRDVRLHRSRWDKLPQ